MPELARLRAGQGAPWALEAAGGETLPWAHSAVAPAALDAAAASRRGPQPRPILVKGDLRRFPTPPGVDTAPLRIQARLTGAPVPHTAHNKYERLCMTLVEGRAQRTVWRTI